MKPVLSSGLFSLSEVRRIGHAAHFLDWGESLLYRGGALFGLHEDPPEALPVAILEAGVGIAYGWRHLAACECAVYCG